MAERLELTTTAIANGGEAIARDENGRVVFVAGALPNETVIVEVERSARTFAHGVATQIISPSPQRQAIPCPHVARGCGGCGWQHIAREAQRDFKTAMLADVLHRIGGIESPTVNPGIALPAEAYRTTLRAGVTHGRAGFRRSRSRSIIEVDSCLVAHPLIESLLDEGDYPGCKEVTLRAGARTGERLVLASPSANDVNVPTDVRVVGMDELKRGRHVWYHEEVDGHRWRISATSFFQARPDGAEALIDTISAALDGATGKLIDLCCGVGLLGGALARRDPGRWELTAVERHRPAIHDAQVNLSDINDARIVRASIESWSPSTADVVVADPSRAGLGRTGVAAIQATHASRVVLVSCDAGSLGRDAKLFAEAGYRFAHSTLVDLFPQTPHLEAVSVFSNS